MRWTLFVNEIAVASIFAEDWGRADHIGTGIVCRMRGLPSVVSADVVEFGQPCPHTSF